MKSFFITSSGTDIGKTLVTTSLCWQLKERGKKVHAVKPVITGWGGSQDNDVTLLEKSLGDTKDKTYLYRFSRPLSPDMAARMENKEIDFGKLTGFCNSFSGYDYLFIEGVGGVMVPLNKDKTILDLTAALNIPTILVVGSYLGSLSHTLTALQALHSRNINIHFIIVSESEKDDVSLEETVYSLANFTDIPLIKLERINFRKDWLKEKWKYVPDIASFLFSE